MSALVDAVLKSSVILSLGIAAATLMRRHSAAARHWVLAAAFASAAIVPFLGSVVPRWPASFETLSVLTRPQQPASAGVAGSTAAGPPEDGTAAAMRGTGDADRQLDPWALLGRVVRLVWLTGTLVCLGILLAGIGRLTRLTRGARPIPRGPLVAIAEQLTRTAALRRPVRLLQTDRPTLLMTWGALRPAIIVPAAATAWPDERLRVVLAHELAHVRRGDWALQMIAELMRSVYWFNPLVWIACARLRQDGEHACDDAVLNAGVGAPECARQMLELARAFSRHRRQWLLAPAIVHESNLERRIKAMLNPQTNRAPMSPSIRMVTLSSLVAVAVALGGFSAEGQSRFSVFSGSVVDQLNGVVPDTTLVLVNSASQAKYEVRTDGAGRFQFVGLPAGEYRFEARRPGFATVKGTITVEGRDVQRELRLQIGSVAETVVVSGNAAAPAGAVREATPKRDATGCVPSAVGGDIRPPRKAVEVRPVYPDHLLASGVGDEVRLDARIAADGTVRDVQVLGTPDAALAAAAIEAVRQWEYDWTLLNCVPIELALHVTVKFTPGR